MRVAEAQRKPVVGLSVDPSFAKVSVLFLCCARVPFFLFTINVV
jgi:hypothetical protein